MTALVDVPRGDRVEAIIDFVEIIPRVRFMVTQTKAPAGLPGCLQNPGRTPGDAGKQVRSRPLQAYNDIPAIPAGDGDHIGFAQGLKNLVD